MHNPVHLLFFYKVKFRGAPKAIDLSEFEDNAVWTVENTSWSTDEDDVDSSISFHVKIRRHSRYIMMHVVFPVFMLEILNVCVFLLPCGTGEKNSYAVTVFLSFVVFLTMINGLLPENSKSVALFSVYLVLSTFQSTVITILSLTFSRCSTFDRRKIPIPKLLIKLSQLVKLRYCFCRRSARTHVLEVKYQQADGDLEDFMKEDSNTRSPKNYTWEDVINGLDRLCFVIFFTFSFLLTCVFLIVAHCATRSS